MNKRIPIFIALCSALAWANVSAQKSEPQTASQSLTIQPGQSAFVACFKVNGEPDPEVESLLRKTFEKQKRFNIVSDADAASFVFLVYTEYRAPFIRFAEIRSQDVNSMGEFVYAMTGYVISPARLDQVKGNLDALCAEATWYRQERNRFNPANSSWYLGRLVKKFHEDSDKIGRGWKSDDNRPCGGKNEGGREGTASSKTTAATTIDVKKLDQESTKLNDDGEYEQAATLAERALSIRQSKSPSAAGMIPSLNNLARALIGKGSYKEAETQLRRALTIVGTVEKTNDPLIAEVLNQLASLYFFKGDFSAAAPLYQESLAIIEKALPADDIKHANALNNLAALSLEQGETAKAESLLNRAREIAEKKVKTNRSDAVSILNNLATLHLVNGDYPRAETLYQKALDINEGWRGKINKLMNLARPVVNSSGSMTMDEGEWQNNSPHITDTLNKLALIRVRQRRFDEANELLQRARRIQEYRLGVNHPALAQTFDNLALLARFNHRTADALSWQRRSNEIRETNLRHNLIVGSERQKLYYLAELSGRLDFTLSLHLNDAASDPSACAVAMTALLRHKGRGLDAQTDSIAELRRSVKEQDQALLDNLLEARTRLANLIIAGEAGPRSNEAQTKQLDQEIEKLEEEIGRHSSGFRALTQAITPESVQRYIPANASLIEYALYTPVDEFNQPNSAHRYAAYALTAKGAPQGVDLGEADKIDGLIDRLREALRDPKSANYRVLARV